MNKEEMRINKFTPTKAWRLRQRLDKHLGALVDAVDCLKLARERKAFDRDNFEYSLMDVQRTANYLHEFYKKHK